MYGDTAVIRRRAAALRDQAADLRRIADQLVGQAESVAWTGRAAEAMRARTRERATQLREVADRHDTAADSLDLHGAEVDRLKEAISERERRAGALVSDQALPDFDPPSAGHRDWLILDLPGL